MVLLQARMCICPIICENLCRPFWSAPGSNLGPFRAPKMGLLINCIRVLWFIWDLGLVLFDSPKDVVFGKIFVFCNILNLPGVNWAQKWTKTVNFSYIPFLPKNKFWKIVITLSLSYERLPWSKFQQNWTIFAG